MGLFGLFLHPAIDILPLWGFKKVMEGRHVSSKIGKNG